MIMLKVRAKIRPWEEIEVSETEALDLRRMGALVDDEDTEGPTSSTTQPRNTK
jgi:hypothetical protein